MVNANSLCPTSASCRITGEPMVYRPCLSYECQLSHYTRTNGLPTMSVLRVLAVSSHVNQWSTDHVCPTSASCLISREPMVYRPCLSNECQLSHHTRTNGLLTMSVRRVIPSGQPTCCVIQCHLLHRWAPFSLLATSGPMTLTVPHSILFWRRWAKDEVCLDVNN